MNHETSTRCYYCGKDMLMMKYPQRRYCSKECKKKGGVKKSYNRYATARGVSFLRQWLNEDRIIEGKKMVTNEQIEHFLFYKRHELDKQVEIRPKETEKDISGKTDNYMRATFSRMLER